MNSLEYLQEDKKSSLGSIKVDLMRTRPVRTTFSGDQDYCDQVQHCLADQIKNLEWLQEAPHEKEVV